MANKVSIQSSGQRPGGVIITLNGMILEGVIAYSIEHSGHGEYPVMTLELAVGELVTAGAAPPPARQKRRTSPPMLGSNTNPEKANAEE